MARGDIIGAEIIGGSTYKNGVVLRLRVEGFGTGLAFNFGLDARNRPTASTPYVDVVSEGFDEDGNPTTFPRRVYLTKVIRKPYPDNASLDITAIDTDVDIDCGLSAGVHDDDRDGGAGTSGTDPLLTVPAGFVTDTSDSTPNNAATDFIVTNNSTLDYPKCTGVRWMTTQYQTVDEAIDIELMGGSGYCHNSRPAACVIFEAEDEYSETVQTIVRAITVSRQDGIDDSKICGWIWPFTPSHRLFVGGTDGKFTVNAKICPWVGDEDSVFDTRTTADGAAQPSESPGPISFLCNANGTFGELQASISAAGNDGTGAVGETLEEADLNPFLTIDAAAAALKAAANSLYGRNTVDNCIINVIGTRAWFSSGFTGGNTKAWLWVRPHPTLGGSALIGSASNTAINAWVRVSVDTTHANTGAFVGSTSTGLLWIDAPTWDITGIATVWQWKVVYCTYLNIININGLTHFSSDRSPFALVRGVDCKGLDTHAYAIIGCKNFRAKFQETGNAQGHATSNNCLIWCCPSFGIDGPGLAQFAHTSDLNNLGIIGNSIFEGIGAFADALIGISADESTSTTNHFVLAHITDKGRRGNIAYNENGTEIKLHTNWFMMGCVWEDLNNKGDTYVLTSGANGARMGHFSVMYGVNFKGNHIIYANFPLEFNGLNAGTGAATFVDDASDGPGGTGLGNGDYTPAPGSALRGVLQPDEIFVPFGLFGNVRPTDGTGSIGAIEADPVVPTTNTFPALTIDDATNESMGSAWFPVGAASLKLCVEKTDGATAQAIVGGGAEASSNVTTILRVTFSAEPGAMATKSFDRVVVPIEASRGFGQPNKLRLASLEIDAAGSSGITPNESIGDLWPDSPTTRVFTFDVNQDGATAGLYGVAVNVRFEHADGLAAVTDVLAMIERIECSLLSTATGHRRSLVPVLAAILEEEGA